MPVPLREAVALLEGRDQLSSSSIATKATTTDRQLGSHYRVRLLKHGLPHLSRSAQRLFAVDFHKRTRGIDSVRLKGTRFKLLNRPGFLGGSRP